MAGRTSADGRGIIAVGASAGGIDAIQRLMKELPEDIEAAICIVLHIPASSRSLLPQVIARQTRLPVCQAATGLRLRPGHVYVAPPDQHLLARNGAAWLDRGPKENGVRPAVDPLFRSVAEGYGARGIAVVLSGSLSDGAAGAAAVAAAGGAVLVQAPVDAIVPQHAGGDARDRPAGADVHRHRADRRARAQGRRAARARRARRAGRRRAAARSGMSQETLVDPAFEALLQFLKRSRGFDFTGYKRASLDRRFRRRMEAIECTSYGDYLDYLEVHPEEYEALFDTLLINVTDFFRDPASLGAGPRRGACR